MVSELAHIPLPSLDASTLEIEPFFESSSNLFSSLGTFVLSICALGKLQAPSSATMAGISASMLSVDVYSPYYLCSSDNPGTILVSKPLLGDNFETWKRSMKMALNAKNKIGFVDGTLLQPSLEDSLREHHLWKRCNDLVLS